MIKDREIVKQDSRNLHEIQTAFFGLPIFATLSLAKEAYKSKKYAAFMQREHAALASALQAIPEVRGVFASGFPFSMLKPNGELIESNEIQRHIDELAQRIISSQRGEPVKIEPEFSNPDELLFYNDIPDKTGKLRVKEVLSAIPDLDVQVIVSTITPELEKRVRNTLAANGFWHNSHNCLDALHTIHNTMRDVEAGKTPKGHLPVDLNLISVEEMKRGLSGLVTSLDMSPLRVKTMKYWWIDNTSVNNFSFDVLTSLSISYADSTVQQLLLDTRKVIAQTHDVREIIDSFDTLGQIRERMKRTYMPDSRETELLKERLDLWRVGVKT